MVEQGAKMAKGQMRSNREAKKPKQPKKVVSSVAEPFKVPAGKASKPAIEEKKK